MPPVNVDIILPARQPKGPSARDVQGAIAGAIAGGLLPDYEQWTIVTNHGDGTFDIKRPGRTFSRAGALNPKARKWLKAGDVVLCGYYDRDRARPYIKSDGPAGSQIEAGPRPRLSGLWPQWEGSPELALQPGDPGKAFVPGFAQWVADQGQFLPGFHFPIIWSSPILWPSKDNTGQRMALCFVTADSDAEGAPLSLWLEVWGPDATDPYLILLNSTRLAGYPALGVHGVALEMGTTYDWGGEFMPCKLHYLPSTDQLLVLGPAWDSDGRNEAFLCSSAGALVKKSVPGLNVAATVAPYAIVTGQWANLRTVHYLTNAFSETDEISRIVRGYVMNSQGEYKEKWSLDPFGLLPSGGGLQVLKPCNTRASGRNDRRWPYATKSNVVALQLCSGTGITGEDVQSVNYNPPGSPDDRRDTYIWAGAKTTCFTFCSHLVAFLDAETGVYKHQSFDFVNGSNNRLVEESTLGLADHGLSEGTTTTYAYYYGWYPDESPRTPENIREFVAPSLVVTAYREPLDYPDYNTMGALPLTFPLASYNTATGFGAAKWGAGGTVTTAVRTLVGGAFDGQFVGAGNYGFNPGFVIGTGLNSEQPVNSQGGCFDSQDSYYCRYTLPWIYVRGGNDCEGYANNFSASSYEVPFDGYVGSTYSTLANDSIICARVDQHMRTFLKKVPKNPDGDGWLPDVRVETSQMWDVGTLGADGLYPLTLVHPRACLEQCWAMAAQVSEPGFKIRELLLSLCDKRTELAQESRPVLEVRDAITLEHLLDVELCLDDLATSTDADFDTYPSTVAIEGRYLYDSRGHGKPQMRCTVDATVAGEFGQGGAAAHVTIYHSDRRDPGAVVVQRVHTIVFGDADVSAYSHTITEAATYPTPEVFQVPQTFDYWAQGLGGRAFYREGNVYSSQTI